MRAHGASSVQSKRNGVVRIKNQTVMTRNSVKCTRIHKMRFDSKLVLCCDIVFILRFTFREKELMEMTRKIEALFEIFASQNSFMQNVGQTHIKWGILEWFSNEWFFIRILDAIQRIIQ